jgi:hypothetical protein
MRTQMDNGAIVYTEELLWNYSIGPDKPRHADLEVLTSLTKSTKCRTTI